MKRKKKGPKVGKLRYARIAVFSLLCAGVLAASTWAARVAFAVIREARSNPGVIARGDTPEGHAFAFGFYAGFMTFCFIAGLGGAVAFRLVFPEYCLHEETDPFHHK